MSKRLVIQESVTIPSGEGVVDKVDRYNWVKTDQPGDFQWINKAELRVEQQYQRGQQVAEIARITREWSWLACGALIVARRGGFYWIVDGQQRWLAACRRSDIRDLPCIVLPTASVIEESAGFLRVNAGRKAIEAIEKYRALITRQDETALFVESALEDLGISVVSHASRGQQVKCIDWLLAHAAMDPARFLRVLLLTATLSEEADVPLPRALLGGLWYLDRYLKVPGTIDNKRVVARLSLIGPVALQQSVVNMQVLLGKGGERVYAIGIVERMNKGLSKKYSLNGGLAEEGQDGEAS